MTGETAVEEALRSARRSPNAEPRQAADPSSCSKRRSVCRLFRDAITAAPAPHREFQSVIRFRATFRCPSIREAESADVEQAQADLLGGADMRPERPRAYDVRVAWLDLSASDSSVRVAERNRSLAERALIQAQDRMGTASPTISKCCRPGSRHRGRDNYIQSLFFVNVSLISFAARRRRRGNKARRHF